MIGLSCHVGGCARSWERRADGGVALTHSVGSRLVCLWLLGDRDIDVPCTPLNAGKIDQPYGGWAHG